MKNYYLGIDSGGTSYDVIAVSTENKILFKYSNKSVHLNNVGIENFSLHICDSVKSVLAKRKYTLNNCKGICIGVAGARNEKDRKKLRKSLVSHLGISNLIIETDTEIARYGAFGGGDGMLLICGTGSILYGKIKNKIYRIGGWGKILGDEGSGYKIGLEALKILTMEFDLNIPNSNLANALKERFNITQKNIIEKVYRKNFNIQELVPLIFELAKNGNRTCLKILNNAVTELTVLIKRFFEISGLKKADLAFSGNIVEKNKFFSDVLKKDIIKKFGIRINIVSKKFSPEFGAYLKAKKKLNSIMIKTDLILILDFGSQYTQLIARRIRENKVYSEIQPFNFDVQKYIIDKSGYELKGVILSGGPSSVLDKDSPVLSQNNYNYLVENDIPILGICYGLQLLTFLNGGKIHKSNVREYGNTHINIIKSKSLLLKDTAKKFTVWMSHGDSIDKLPGDFHPTSRSTNNILSSFESTKRNLFGLQFHPEVMHTEYGKQIIFNFLFEICKIKNLFKTESFIQSKINDIRIKVKDDYAICALSGGVDSSVAAILVQKAIGKQLICVHIDNGLMRKDESKKIISLFRKNFSLNLRFIDASNIFLNRLNKISDPEKKRKIIGKTFIEVFEKEAKSLEKKNKKIKYLIQGTLYPDVIESVSFKGPSATIKSHHNVGGLPEKMNLELIEPFRELFKDEVREIGRKLKLQVSFINRHPFPGPGLAVRVLGDITQERLKILREADDIFISELKYFGLYTKIWQAFAILLPVKTVGVMGDERSYENVIALRAVTSTDGMTADFFGFDKHFLTNVSNKIINGVKGVNRVVYDISSKPPATIEWE